MRKQCGSGRWKRIFSVAVLSAATCVCFATAAGFAAFGEETEQSGSISVPNPDFEENAETAVSWTLEAYPYGAEGVDFALVSGEEAYAGNSLKVTDVSTTGAHAIVRSTAVSVEPETEYFVSFRINSTSGDTVVSPCIRQFSDADGTVGVSQIGESYYWLSDYNVVGATGGWTYVCMYFTTSAEAHSAMIHLEMTPTLGGAVWLDEFRMGIQPEYDGGFNGGFETEGENLPGGWNYSGAQTFSADTETYYEGRSSLFVRTENYVTPAKISSRERLPVNGGEEYRFSVRVMSRRARYAQAYFNLIQYDADGGQISVTQSPYLLLNEGGDWSDWRELWLGLKLALNTRSVGIELYVSAGTAEIRFDGVSCRSGEYAFYEDFSDVASSGEAALWTVSGDVRFTGEELILGSKASAGAEWSEFFGGCTYEFSGLLRGDSEAAPVIHVEYYSWRDEFVSVSDEQLPLSDGEGMKAFSFSVTVPYATYAHIVLENLGGGEVIFDDLRIEMTENPRETASGWQGSWISCGGEEAQHTGFRYRWFRKTFAVSGDVERALLQYTGDDSIYGYINGSGSLGNTTFYSTVVVDVTSRLREGENVLAFYVASGGDFCAILYDLTLVYADGRTEHIVSDESTLGWTEEVSGWKNVGFDDSDWMTSRFFGRVPCQPWGTIPYTETASSEREVTLLDATLPSSVSAGEETEVALSFRPLHDAEAPGEIRAELVGEDGEIQPFSVFLVPADGEGGADWTAGKDVTGVYTLYVPDFTENGVYSLRIDETDVDFTGSEENMLPGTLSVVAADRELTVSEVRKEDGVTRLYIDGKKVNPMLYLRDVSTKFKTSYAESMFGSGVVLLGFPNTRTDYVNGRSSAWTGPGKYDFSEFDRIIYETLEGAPEAMIMLMLDADPPDWWLDANPDERAEVVDDGGTITYPGVSYASEKWRNDVGEFFRALLNHVVSQPYATHVFGVKLGAGSTYEWQQNGMTLSSNGDYSEAALNAFRKWLSEKYGTDTALRKAWGNGSVTLQTAQIPTRAERKAAGYRTLLDGVKQRNVIDYQLFYSDMTTDSILYFAEVIKKVCGGKWIVGTYNGYMINSLTYEANNIVNASFSRLLSSDFLDFFCAPILYAARMSGMSAGYMTMVDSVLDAGKMFFSEVDERTVFYDDNGWQAPYLLQEWGQTYTLRDTIEMLKRDFANVLAKGAGLWWYDMWGGWFDDPEIYSLLSVMSEEMEYDLSRPAESVSPVAWIQADDLLAYMPYDFDGTYDVLLQTHSNQKESLAKVGVPYDMYYLSDLEGGLDKKYDIYIIEAFGIDKDTRLDIELYLERDGVTIIWVGLPGIYGEDGAVDPASVSELVGMDISLTSSAVYSVTIGNDSHYATEGMQGFVYGNPASVGRVSPIGYVTDPDAVALGTLGASGLTGLAVKEIPLVAGESWTSVYSAVGNIPAEFIRNLLKYAGANIYTEEGDVVFANGNYLAIDSPYGGARCISLGGRYDVYDVFSGKTVAEGVEFFETELEAGRTYLWRLAPSAEVPDPEPDPDPDPDPDPQPGGDSSGGGEAPGKGCGSSIGAVSVFVLLMTGIILMKRKQKRDKHQ